MALTLSFLWDRRSRRPHKKDKVELRMYSGLSSLLKSSQNAD
jgi:hypothetical protein